jgi:hypothetical protein
MHRSSESIAALAAALAKAQSELSDPEKSLVGTIGSDRPGEGARTFRYAPLSSGLDIVRKAGLPAGGYGGPVTDGHRVTRCSPWLASRARTTSMRRI